MNNLFASAGQCMGRLGGLLLLALTLGLPAARAQNAPTAPLLYADQMPALPGGGGNAALVAALQRTIKYPKPTVANPVSGRVVVSITVAADGSVQAAKVVKSPRPDCEAAVLAAVRQLPRFVPGQQGGRAVPVVVTVPLTLLVDQLVPVSATATADKP